MELNLSYNLLEDNSCTETSNYQIVNDRTCTLLCSEEEKLRIAAKCGIIKFGVKIYGKQSSLTPHIWKLGKEVHRGFNEEDITLTLTSNTNIIFETEKVECAIRALKITHLCGVETETRAIEDYFLTKHILRGIDVSVSLTDIFEQLHKDKIPCLRVTRFTKPKSQDPIPTILICEFGKVTRSTARLHGIGYRICPFKEQPRICQNCMGYGHSLSRCQNPTKCPKCGAEHKLENCKRDSAICFRCGKKHLASSKFCDAFKAETKVYTISKAECIPVYEARLIVKENIAGHCEKFIPVHEATKILEENVAGLGEKFVQCEDSVLKLQSQMEVMDRKIQKLMDQISALQDALLNALHVVWGIRNSRIRREG